MASRSRTPQFDRWRASPEFRRTARRNAKTNLAKLKSAPRCGAAGRPHGKPCGNAAMKNGRCSMHGGKTPRGSQWHIIQFPADEVKFHRKLKNQKRYATKRAARLAAMTREQLAAHAAWHRSHKPGAEAARNAERERTRQNAEARSLLVVEPSRPVSGTELAELMTTLAAAQARLAELEAREAWIDEEGIFS